MNELRFIQIQKDNAQHYETFKDLMILYNKELCTNRPNYPIHDGNVLQVTQGCINMQGPYDRHLELVFIGNDPIGFLYAKVDHEGHKGFIKPEYGYIMEFYVKPEHRRKGYGRIMFRRIEQHFSGHGVKRMYLNADPVLGEPFWKAMGFVPTGEIQPHNNMIIFEKEVSGHEIVTISVSDYLTHELVEKIAFMQRHSNKLKDYNQMRQWVYSNKYESDCFNIIALSENDAVIGRLFCIRNQENPKRWYYGDLAVNPAYRRMKIATRMIKDAIQRMSDMGGETICCYVEPENTASLNLQKSLGFIEKPILPFNLLINEGRIMLELIIGQQFNAIPATVEEARFVMMFYAQNREALHGKYISLAEWKEILSKDAPDEQNFLICKGAIPLAWLRVNGLNNKDMVWISMLAVSDKFQRQGVGTYAVKFAEEYAQSKGFTKIGIHTTEDNIVAQSLYKKCGYTVTEYGDCTTGDGAARKGYTFEKTINNLIDT